MACGVAQWKAHKLFGLFCILSENIKKEEFEILSVCSQL